MTHLGLRLLLAAHGDTQRADLNGFTPLHAAVEAGRLEIVRLLLEHGAPVDACDKEGTTPLLIAAREGHHDIATTLVAAGAWNTGAALHAAAYEGFHEVVRVLIEGRALPWLLNLMEVFGCA